MIPEDGKEGGRTILGQPILYVGGKRWIGDESNGFPEDEIGKSSRRRSPQQDPIKTLPPQQKK